MIFTVNRAVFVKLLKLVVGNPAAGAVLRLEAHNMRLKIGTDAAGSECSAIITKKGVAFIRAYKVLSLIRSFKGKKTVTLVITPEGLRVSTFRVSANIWLAIFDNPATAPAHIGADALKPAIPAPDDLLTVADIPRWRRNLNHSDIFPARWLGIASPEAFLHRSVCHIFPGRCTPEHVLPILAYVSRPPTSPA